MNENSFQSFIRLVELDQKIGALTQEAGELAQRIDSLNQHIATLHAITKKAYDTAHTLQKKVDELELELKAIDEMQKDKRFKLGLAASPKEFFSLEHEIKALEGRRSLLDEQTLDTMGQLEKANEEYQRAKSIEEADTADKRRAVAELESRRDYVATLRHAYGEQRVKDTTLFLQNCLLIISRCKEKLLILLLKFSKKVALPVFTV